MFKIWSQLVHYQRSYNKKIDGPKFADPSIAAVSPKFKTSMAFALPLWAYVLVGFCPTGFCPTLDSAVPP